MCNAHAYAAAGASVAACEAAPPRQQSFILVKPDGVGRGKIAEIMRRFEERGYRLVAIKVSNSS